MKRSTDFFNGALPRFFVLRSEACCVIRSQTGHSVKCEDIGSPFDTDEGSNSLSGQKGERG